MSKVKFNRKLNNPNNTSMCITTKCVENFSLIGIEALCQVSVFDTTSKKLEVALDQQDHITSKGFSYNRNLLRV